jgi:hypothetical protein
MKNTYSIGFFSLVVALCAAGYYFYPLVGSAPEQASIPDTATPNEYEDVERRQFVPTEAKTDTVNAAGERFMGKLEKVDTGCFADGECFVVVGGKHVTTTIGWSQNVVGSIKGAESIGDLENMIGRTVEVYASKSPEGTYTLYGNANFYIHVK